MYKSEWFTAYSVVIIVNWRGGGGDDNRVVTYLLTLEGRTYGYYRNSLS